MQDPCALVSAWLAWQSATSRPDLLGWRINSSSLLFYTCSWCFHPMFLSPY
jgi:hypothetical protein